MHGVTTEIEITSGVNVKSTGIRPTIGATFRRLDAGVCTFGPRASSSPSVKFNKSDILVHSFVTETLQPIHDECSHNITDYKDKDF